jgi:hypothetical protein
MLLGLTHGLNLCQFSAVRALFAEHLAEQTDIRGVIFD